MYTIINGTEYELATTLRVVYKVQGQHNHKPYAEIFQNIGSMPLEDQINILFAAFECANPEVSRTFNKSSFLNYYLDHYTLKDVMDQLQQVISAVMGTTASDGADEGESVTEKNL